MTQVLFQEFKETPIHIQAIAAFDLVRTLQRANDEELWLSPREITEYFLKLLAADAHQQYWHPLQQPADLERYA